MTEPLFAPQVARVPLPTKPGARMTRKQLLQHLHDHGYPFSESFFDKLCAPAVNQGPPAVTRFGGRLMYDPDSALVWAESRCRPVAQRVA
jgi:hypothetical protein